MRGSILSEQAYALGKMLDHSSWQKGPKVLPRNITPSDIDTPNITMFDNNGLIMMCEFVRGVACQWDDLKFGQRWLYEGLIKNTAHCAVLCSHSVVPEDGRAIDSRHDVTAFQVMVHDFSIVKTPLHCGNELWQTFVFRWFQAPRVVRRKILAAAE